MPQSLCSGCRTEQGQSRPGLHCGHSTRGLACPGMALVSGMEWPARRKNQPCPALWSQGVLSLHKGSEGWGQWVFEFSRTKFRCHPPGSSQNPSASSPYSRSSNSWPTPLPLYVLTRQLRTRTHEIRAPRVDFPLDYLQQGARGRHAGDALAPINLFLQARWENDWARPANLPIPAWPLPLRPPESNSVDPVA